MLLYRNLQNRTLPSGYWSFGNCYICSAAAMPATGVDYVTFSQLGEVQSSLSANQLFCCNKLVPACTGSNFVQGRIMFQIPNLINSIGKVNSVGFQGWGGEEGNHRSG